MSPESTSLLIRNGLVRTLWAEQPQCEALLLEGGRVRWMGNNADAPGAQRTVDLGGRVVLPGLIDAHCHLYWMAQDRLQLNVGTGEIRGISDLIERLRAEEATHKSGSDWLFGVGLNEWRLREARLPTRDDLDRVSTERPVVLRRVCGHAMVANSAALKTIGITESTPDPVGGIIEREGVRPNGVLRERALEPLLRLLPTPSVDELSESLRSVAQSYLACGVTGATEAAVGFTTAFEKEWAVWEALRASGTYPLRMAFMLRLGTEEARARHIRPTSVDLDWQVDMLKFFADGTVGSRSAAISKPYEGSGCACGLYMQAPERLSEEIEAAVADGWHIAVHAIGDRAIDLTANIFNSMRNQCDAVRLRVEHLALPSRSALEALGRVGAIAVPQPTFLRELGDGFVRALGAARAEQLYPGRSLLAHGLIVAGSSDAPAASLSPFVGIASAMTRTTASGRPLNIGERLSASEAVSMYTSGAARALGHSQHRGVLRPGAVGDLIVLDRDPLNCPSEDILGTQVKATIVRGRMAYENWLNR